MTVVLNIPKDGVFAVFQLRSVKLNAVGCKIACMVITSRKDTFSDNNVFYWSPIAVNENALNLLGLSCGKGEELTRRRTA